MSDDSQEKRHPATPHKLRRARREGRIPHANDVLALTMWPTIIWLIFSWPSFEASLRRLLSIAVNANFREPSEEVVGRLTALVFQLSISIVGPFLIIAFVIAVLISILDNGGVIFSGKPVSPDFNRLNPAEGFKRIFSVRTAVESGYGLARMLVFVGCAVGVLWAAIDDLSLVQSCGLLCLNQGVESTIYPILALFFAIFVVAGVLDFLISRKLFMHEMRMSDTELKRDHKETYGTPQFKHHRREIGRTLVTASIPMGLNAASFLVIGEHSVVGVRYVVNEAPAPFIVLKVSGDDRRETMREAGRLRIPLVPNAHLARNLDELGSLGGIVPRETFTDVAKEILRLELA